MKAQITWDLGTGLITDVTFSQTTTINSLTDSTIVATFDIGNYTKSQVKAIYAVGTSLADTFDETRVQTVKQTFR